MPKPANLTGLAFGRLTAAECVGRSAHGKMLWRCDCSCGGEKTAPTGDLTSGTTRSCGCLQSEMAARRLRIHRPAVDPTALIDELRGAVSYDPETGTLTWRNRERADFSDEASWGNWEARFAGRPAFATLSAQGYLVGAYRARQHKAHRVAWAIVHGYWPDQIDHINGVRSDNRLSNMRDVPQLENGKNCKRHSRNDTGVAGVSWNKLHRKYRAFIMADGVRHYLGAFTDLEAAAAARKAAEQQFGYHPNHGRAA